MRRSMIAGEVAGPRHGRERIGQTGLQRGGRRRSGKVGARVFHPSRSLRRCLNRSCGPEIMRERVSHFELFVLLAVMRLDNDAYGVQVCEEMISAR